VSRYKKGRTNLDYTEARDSEWQWHQLGHMQVCTLLQRDNHASTPPLCFLQAGCPSCRPTNSTEGISTISTEMTVNVGITTTTEGTTTGIVTTTIQTTALPTTTIVGTTTVEATTTSVEPTTTFKTTTPRVLKKALLQHCLSKLYCSECMQCE